MYGLDPALKGVLITQVRPDSQASYLGVTVGNVITAVDRTPVATPDDVHKALKEAHEQDRTCTWRCSSRPRVVRTGFHYPSVQRSPSQLNFRKLI